MSDFQPLVLTATPFSWQHRDPVPEQRGPGLPGSPWVGSPCPLGLYLPPSCPTKQALRRGQGACQGAREMGFVTASDLNTLVTVWQDPRDLAEITGLLSWSTDSSWDTEGAIEQPLFVLAWRVSQQPRTSQTA